MKSHACFAICAALHLFTSVAVTPVSKVLDLLGQLEAKVSKNGAEEEKLFKEYMEWCKNGAADTGYEIKTAKAQVEDLTSTIGKAVADIDASKTKIEDLSSSIAQDNADLKAATTIREKEQAEFKVTEDELVEAVDMLDRAINILEKKMKGSAALMQARFNSKDMKSMLAALNAVVDAASLSLRDKQKLTALAQNQAAADEDDSDDGAPSPEAYKSHSGSIIDVLEDMREKAEGQLAEARKEESSAKHNFQMLKQSLVDQIEADSKELEEGKATKNAAAGTKAGAEGDLAVTKKDLADDEETLENMQADCQSKKDDHEESVKSRAEELKALAEAKKIISSMTGAAEGRVYSAASFLQITGAGQRGTLHSHLSTRADLVHLEVANMVRQLAKKEKSSALMQLAGRIQAAFRSGQVAVGGDPFAKVKSMISEMITKLEKEAQSEASHKEYCDKELGDTKTKMDELQASLSKNSAKKDKDMADSVKLKGEVQELQAELSKIAKSQSEADTMRREESSAFIANKADLEQGIEGVRMALKVLREHYASDDALLQQPAAPGTHSDASGAGGSIISVLEVIQSDFAQSLAAAEADEQASATEYEKTSMMNKLTKAQKEKDVEYKTREAASLDKSVSELASDIDSAQSELTAIMDYNKGLLGACVAKPETYAERQGRREAEVEGLKHALKVLQGEAVLMQQPQGQLRGSAITLHKY